MYSYMELLGIIRSLGNNREMMERVAQPHSCGTFDSSASHVISSLLYYHNVSWIFEESTESSVARGQWIKMANSTKEMKRSTNNSCRAIFF